MEDQYRRLAGWYDTIFEPLNSGLRQIGLKMYPPEAGMEVLDIGCGTGAHLKLYRDLECNVCGIDQSEAMLNIARKKLGETADLRLGDATGTGFPEQRFDLILCCTVLHEMPQEVRVKVLAEAGRILRKDGRMLVIDFHPGMLKKIKGYYSKLIITIAEISAGREHFRNYRHFIRYGGLPVLVKDSGFKIDQQKIVSGGNFGIYLLSR
jgi:ubiquinone/menaquinone biosynthesis C-methylase UbiE